MYRAVWSLHSRKCSTRHLREWRLQTAQTFIEGHTDLNHENNKCLISSETIQALSSMKFAVPLILSLTCHTDFRTGYRFFSLSGSLLWFGCQHFTGVGQHVSEK